MKSSSRRNRLSVALSAVLALLFVAAISQAGFITQVGSRYHVQQGGGGGDEVSDGESVVITGTGFGSAPDVDFAGPQIRATAVGAEVALAAPFDDTDGTGIPAPPYLGYNDDERGRAIRALYSSFNENAQVDLALAWDNGANFTNGQTLHVVWYVRMVTRSATFPAEGNDNGGCDPAGGGFDTWQWKIIRVRNNLDVQDDFTDGDGYIAHWDNEDGSFIDFSGGGFENINCEGSGGASIGGDDLPTGYTGDWYRCELYITFSSSGAGRIRLYVYREGGSRQLVVNLSGITNLNGTRQYRWIVWQNYLGNTDGDGDELNGGTRIALDGLYVQTDGVISVWLTDESNNLLEPQPFSAWDDDEITVTLNAPANRTGNLKLRVLSFNIATGAHTMLAERTITVN